MIQLGSISYDEKKVGEHHTYDLVTKKLKSRKGQPYNMVAFFCDTILTLCTYLLSRVSCQKVAPIVCAKSLSLNAMYFFMKPVHLLSILQLPSSKSYLKRLERGCTSSTRPHYLRTVV